jgi:hypothetical protein
MSTLTGPGRGEYSWAMHSSTQAWLVRKLYSGTLRKLAQFVSGNVLPVLVYARLGAAKRRGAVTRVPQLG